MTAELLERLESFNDGDLVAASDIVDMATSIGTSGDYPAWTGLCLEIARLFSDAIRSGDLDREGAESVRQRARELSGGIDGPDEKDVEPELESCEDRTVAVDDPDIVHSFLNESFDHLNDIEDRVLKLEQDADPELIDEVFRSMHTIKGVASFVGFTNVKDISHELETLLDDARNGRRRVDEEMVTILLAGIDVLNHIVGSIAEQIHAAAEPVVSVVEPSAGHLSVVDRIRALGEPDVSGSDAVPAKPAGAVRSASPEEAPIVTAAIAASFVEESHDLLDQVEQILLGDPESSDVIVVSPQGTDEVFRSIHTIKGNAGFFWFGDLERICMNVENRLDQFRKTGAGIDRTGAGVFLELVDRIRRSIEAVKEEPQRYAVGSAADPGGETLGEILVEMGDVAPDVVQGALEIQNRRLGEILVEEQSVPAPTVQAALAEQNRRRGGNKPGTSSYSIKRKDIRVDTTKLDKLFELVGELVTAESMVSGNIDVDGRDLTTQRALSYLQKITREIQQMTMGIRMIPLEGIFGKMRRLVRDLSSRFEKDVDIRISGEETEMDKNIIEQVSDPLVHIIRNSIDHGIEPPEEREASGKRRTGLVHLSARHEGNEIWIAIQDDGKGLNRGRILAKAKERGLVQGNEADLSDEEVWRFVFEPAFSTADHVSDISGRGVGMDVVRRNIEKLRGRIDVRSVEGVGTTFVLRIPLTLAILDGATFRIGDTKYSVPTTEVVTFQSYSDDQIVKIDTSHKGFRLRDTVIPITSYGTTSCESEHAVVIVLKDNDGMVALLVDEVFGHQQFVVRPLPDYIEHMQAVSGCSIQGDGTISFILDVGELSSLEVACV